MITMSKKNKMQVPALKPRNTTKVKRSTIKHKNSRREQQINPPKEITDE